MSMTGMMFTSVTGCNCGEAARRRRRPSALLRQGSATWTSHGAGAAGWIVSIACTFITVADIQLRAKNTFCRSYRTPCLLGSRPNLQLSVACTKTAVNDAGRTSRRPARPGCCGLQRISALRSWPPSFAAAV